MAGVWYNTKFLGVLDFFFLMLRYYGIQFEIFMLITLSRVYCITNYCPKEGRLYIILLFLRLTLKFECDQSTFFFQKDFKKHLSVI